MLLQYVNTIKSDTTVHAPCLGRTRLIVATAKVEATQGGLAVRNASDHHRVATPIKVANIGSHQGGGVVALPQMRIGWQKRELGSSQPQRQTSSEINTLTCHNSSKIIHPFVGTPPCTSKTRPRSSTVERISNDQRIGEIYSITAKTADSESRLTNRPPLCLWRGKKGIQ